MVFKMSRRKKGAEGSQLAWDLDFVVISRRQLISFHTCIRLLPPSHTHTQCVQHQTRSARSGEKANFIGVMKCHGSNEKSREAATSWTEKSSWRTSPRALCDRSRLLFAAMCSCCCAIPSDAELILTYTAAPEAWVPFPSRRQLAGQPVYHIRHYARGTREHRRHLSNHTACWTAQAYYL